MKVPLYILIFVFTAVSNGAAYMVNNNPNHHSEVLDDKGNYILEWVVDSQRETVTFKVTVKTKGYVGLGISKPGKMSSADIVMGGVFPSGQAYLSDRHSTLNSLPAEDLSQDWILLSATENATHTFLHFWRKWDTCDEKDEVITNNKISLIWAFGEEDNGFEYHHQNRGVFEVYLLAPDYTPRIIYGEDNLPKIPEQPEVKLWSVRNVMDLRPNRTLYWCSLHKAPKLLKKHHVTGFQFRSNNPHSKDYTHHMVMYKCTPPPGQNANELFGPWVNIEGQECLAIRGDQSQGPIPVQYCSDVFEMWAIGGNTYFHPDHVGIPFGEREDEYYVIQIHYENPLGLTNVILDTSVDTFYTSDLRPNDGGITIYRHSGSAGFPPSLLIPPKSINQTIYGHCSPHCTEIMFPPSGIKIVSVTLHAHSSGKQLKLRHFRGNKELEWIASDENYNNKFQQTQVLQKEFQVLPGDQLTTECVYDSTWTNHTVVAGFSTSQEMCIIFAVYYSKLKEYGGQCDGQIVSYKDLEYFLGIQNFTRNPSDLDWTVTEPEHLRGLTIEEVSDFHVNWNLKRRRELELFHLHRSQISNCGTGLYVDNPRSHSFPANIPYLPEGPYRPKESCSQEDITDNSWPLVSQRHEGKGWSAKERVSPAKNYVK